jgi:hypothetical protein
VQQPHESSFAFSKRVEDYHLERASVGLPEIPDEELVIDILNRLDVSFFKIRKSQNSELFLVTRSFTDSINCNCQDQAKITESSSLVI